MKNYFRILGVHRKSTLEEIKEARRDLAATHHPDKGGDPIQMALLNEAYTALTNPAERKRYLILLEGAGKTCPTCAGSGVRVRQLRFMKREVKPCLLCHGAGVFTKEEK